MSNIKINYHDLNKIVPCPETYEKVKECLTAAFNLKPEDLEGLSLTYKDGEGDFVSVTGEEDYKIFKAFSEKASPMAKLLINLKTEEKAEGKEEPKKGRKMLKAGKLGKMLQPGTAEYEKFKEKIKIKKEIKSKMKAMKEKMFSHMYQKAESDINKKFGIKEEKPEDKKEGEKPAEKVDRNVHIGVICDGCKMNPIGKSYFYLFYLVGTRYKCGVCPNFDFCENCEKEKGEQHGHFFYKLRFNDSIDLRKKEKKKMRKEMMKNMMMRHMPFYWGMNPMYYQHMMPMGRHNQHGMAGNVHRGMGGAYMSQAPMMGMYPGMGEMPKEGETKKPDQTQVPGMHHHGQIPYEEYPEFNEEDLGNEEEYEGNEDKKKLNEIKY